jgi:hypothetical protein
VLCGKGDVLLQDCKTQRQWFVPRFTFNAIYEPTSRYHDAEPANNIGGRDTFPAIFNHTVRGAVGRATPCDYAIPCCA